ncbi:MAG: hypothetical protein AABW63_03230 [Nanoarchaeota archaeon]
MKTKISNDSSRREIGRMEKILEMIGEIVSRKGASYAHDSTPLFYTLRERSLAKSFGGKYRT